MNHTIGKGISYNPFKHQDKHYFGSFFNLADNNIKDVFNEIAQRLNHKDSNPKNIINHYTDKNISLVDFEKFVSLLSNYFPIVNEIDQINCDAKGSNGNYKPKTKEERLGYFKKTSYSLLEAIDKLRNYYTHYHHEPIEIDLNLFPFLDHVLLKTALNTKKNYLKKGKTKELIKDNLKQQFDFIFNIKVEEYLKEKNPTSKKIERAGGKIENFNKSLVEEITSAIYNDAIKDFIYSKGENAELSNRKKTSFSDKDYFYYNDDDHFSLPISSSGIVFLLSCFLNRKEIESLKDNITGYKGKIPNSELTLKHNGIRFMTTHRIYSHWCYKGLKTKIRTSEKATRETLLLQMVDELSKVPDVVYQNISDDLKKTFIKDLNEYYIDNQENQENLYNSKVVHPVIRKRYEDKFNYFAVRFLDEFLDFPTLRFQVHLGNYLEHSTSKNIGNSKTNREIKKKIFVFGKLSEVNKLKNDFFEKNKQNDTSWQFFPNPSYHFPMENSNDLKKANKIGIYINHDKSINKFKHQTQKQTHENKIKLIQKVIGDKSKIKIGQPIAYLSMNDIHSILFEALKNPKIKESGKIDGEHIEYKITHQINKQIKEIQNKNENAKIIKNQQSKQETDFNIDKLIKDVNKEITISEDKIQTLKENKKQYQNYQRSKKSEKHNNSRKRNHILYNSEKGEIATWLANDIKRFFSKDFKDKWKGHHHSNFQRNLAYYNTQKKEVELLLKGLDYRKTIPMLDFSKNSFLDFYRKYLEKRKQYFKNLLSELKNHKSGKHDSIEKLKKKCFTHFKKRNYRNKTIEDKIQNMLANPIFIKRGFMDTKPTMIPGKNFNQNKSDFADWFVAFKEFSEYQKFYDTNLYPIDLSQKSKSATKKINTEIYKQKKNDWAIWQMTKYIFKDIFQQDSQNISLSEIYQSRQEPISNAKNTATDKRKQNSIWDSTIDLQLNRKIKISDVKLKDIGNFRKYENDQRINTFLDYGDFSDWMAYLPNNWQENFEYKPINVIDIQLDDYEKIRQNVLLQEVQNLEREIYNNVSNKNEILVQDSKGNKNPNFKAYILKGLLKQIKNLDITNFKLPQNAKEFDTLTFKHLQTLSVIEQKTTLLILLRNKFAHNQLPNKAAYEFCQTILEREKSQTYAHYYSELFKTLKKELTDI
ncbi:MAG: hypothetical protein GVY05_12600 [Bacteroidetes bacterium]|jgi:hypothetical protein|nr:hypothetical protein [Bacteroidota bacterium]